VRGHHRARARNSFTPTETALGVFSLKEAVYELVADAAEMVPEYLAFSRMIDDLGLHTFEAYSAAREQIISDQVSTMTELSTPVVRLWEGSAARLLGAQCTISGIRPQVAQTIASLGIEFGDIATKATLAGALALALRQAGLKSRPPPSPGTRAPRAARHGESPVPAGRRPAPRPHTRCARSHCARRRGGVDRLA
jgi:rsbT co-antagonist protein RsbR